MDQVMVIILSNLISVIVGAGLSTVAYHFFWRNARLWFSSYGMSNRIASNLEDMTDRLRVDISQRTDDEQLIHEKQLVAVFDYARKLANIYYQDDKLNTMFLELYAEGLRTALREREPGTDQCHKEIAEIVCYLHSL